METFRRLQNLFLASQSRSAGIRGEILAERHLRRRGFAVVTRNWRSPRDRREEIDLVCRDGPVLVFVEVKARAAGARVPGYYAVDARKRKVLRRAIGSYLARLRPAPRTFRFDIVEVAWAARGPEVRHFENIPLFSRHYRRAG
jgi:putative endonuclease